MPITHAQRPRPGEPGERDFTRRRLPSPGMRLPPAKSPPVRSWIERRSAIVTDPRRNEIRHRSARLVPTDTLQKASLTGPNTTPQGAGFVSAHTVIASAAKQSWPAGLSSGQDCFVARSATARSIRDRSFDLPRHRRHLEDAAQYANPAVIAWLVRNDAELALPTVTIAEIAFGIGKIRPAGPGAPDFSR